MEQRLSMLGSVGELIGPFMERGRAHEGWIASSRSRSTVCASQNSMGASRE
jgi:hypothetical protein